MKNNNKIIGCVQVAIKPLIDMGIDAVVLMCLRDIRHNKFEDSLIGTVETSLGQGPIYFNCYPNKTLNTVNLRSNEVYPVRLQILLDISTYPATPTSVNSQ